MDHTFWYLTRASGLVAYLLLFASVALGLAMTTSLFSSRFRRYRVYDIHRFLSLVTLGVTVFHVLIVLPDGYFSFSARQLLVPFASPYRPFSMALGVFALYLMAIIILSFYLRPLVPYRAWRLLHYATFGAFVLALAHGIGAGADTGAGWALFLYAGTGVAVLYLVVYRVLRGSARGLKHPVHREATSPTPARSLG